VSKSADNAGTGALGRWDFGVTDLTYKAALGEVWVIDPYSSSPDVFIIKFKADDLATAPVKTSLVLPVELADAPVLGFAEIPHGDLQGKNLVLVDPTFGTGNPATPQLGIYDDTGNLAPGEVFFPIQGLADGAVISAMDVNATLEEIALFDITTHSFYILGFDFVLKSGPTPASGYNNFFGDVWFFGTVDRTGLRGGAAGLTFNGPDTVLIPGGFINISDTHWALEYNLRGAGGFTGRAIDLSVAGESGLSPDTAFLSMDMGKVGGEDVLFAFNIADDSLYAFTPTVVPHSAPVADVQCGWDATSGSYLVQWTLPATPVDAIHIVENGVQVATIGPQVTSFTSPLPQQGKVLLEVATEVGGVVSGVRFLCQAENTQRPPIEGIVNDATQITTLGGVLSGVAVTKTPATKEDFRGYVVGQTSNDVEVFDYTLTLLPTEKLVLTPHIVTPAGSGNLAAIGIALVNVGGEEHIAILDPDGPTDSGVPSASFFPLNGPNRGVRDLEFNPIDVTALDPAPLLFDWDADDDQNFVAGGYLSAQDSYVLVRILNEGDRLRATHMTPVPQGLLSPFTDRPYTGIGVSVLPSGNLLVAGSDVFSRTYTEALLMTPFIDPPAGGEYDDPKLVGHANGLIAMNEFSGFNYGPNIGPGTIFGFDTAYFPPAEGAAAGVGVSYLPTGAVDLITNPSVNQTLRSNGRLLIQGSNDCSNPDLITEQLLDTTVTVAPAAKNGTGILTHQLATEGKPVDYFYYVMNPSTSDTLRLSLEALLGGTALPAAAEQVVIPPGRYVRRGLPGRAEATIEVRVQNDGTAPASVRFLAGAMGLGKRLPTLTPFRRGDVDQNSIVNITDAIVGLNWLFRGSGEPSCPDTADTDDDGRAGLTDMIVIVNYLFRSGVEPAAPGPVTCGVDPTPDDQYTTCSYACE